MRLKGLKQKNQEAHFVGKINLILAIFSLNIMNYPEKEKEWNANWNKDGNIREKKQKKMGKNADSISMIYIVKHAVHVENNNLFYKSINIIPVMILFF